MRSIVFLMSMSVSLAVGAECFVRTATVSTSTVQRVADIKETRLPYNGLRKCIAQMRVLVDNDWQTVEGEGVAETDQQACQLARDFSQARLLIPAETTVSTESTMICSDEPKIRIRESVRVGEWVRESELRPMTGRDRPFRYQGQTCRWFLHQEPHLGKIIGFAGIMCKLRPNEWQVIDLF